MDIGTGISIASICGVVIAAILKAPWKKSNGHITRKEFKIWLEGLNRWMKSVDENIKDIQEDIKELLKV